MLTAAVCLGRDVSDNPIANFTMVGKHGPMVLIARNTNLTSMENAVLPDTLRQLYVCWCYVIKGLVRLLMPGYLCGCFAAMYRRRLLKTGATLQHRQIYPTCTLTWKRHAASEGTPL